ncbi:hypothetical protein MMC2321_01561 [Chitinophaga sp. MM2321]
MRSESSILVINRQGYLRRLYCPFGVVTIVQVGSIPPRTKMIVQEVQATIQDLLIYIINGKPFTHKHFHILMQF